MAYHHSGYPPHVVVAASQLGLEYDQTRVGQRDGSLVAVSTAIGHALEPGLTPPQVAEAVRVARKHRNTLAVSLAAADSMIADLEAHLGLAAPEPDPEPTPEKPDGEVQLPEVEPEAQGRRKAK